jgi:hypothetical protein
LRLRHGIAAAVLLIAAALIVTAPAALLERLLPEAAPVRLAGCSGTLLGSGSCRVLLQAKPGWMHAGVVAYAWSIEPDKGLQLALVHDGRSAGTLQPRPGGWTARDIDLRLPAWAPDLLPRGLNLDWQSTSSQVATRPSLSCGWRGSSCQGRVRVEVRELTVAQAGRSPVGSYALDLDFSEDGRVGGRLATLAGPVSIEGQIEKPPAAGPRISGRIKLGEGASDELRRLLDNIARRENSDTYLYSYPQ